MEIGDRIKALRELRGMTQTELAQGMGYTDKSTICKIEANQRDLPRSKVAKAAEVLGVEPGYLMGWKADQESFDLQLLAVPAEAVIRSIVGHKDANVTARYTQISDDVKLHWINALEI